jgi:flagellar assembly protein FliH
MDPIIRAAIVSSVPRQLRGAVKRVEAVAVVPVAAHIAKSVLSTPATQAPVSVTAPVSAEERQAFDAAVKQVTEQKAQLLLGKKKLDDEAAALLADAERRGLALGKEKGEREALDLVARKIELLASLADAVETSRTLALGQAEDMLVEIAYAAVCRMVGATAASRETLLDMVRAIARDEHATKQLRVRVHPQDLATLQEDDMPLDARISLQADSAVALGGCLIDSDKGTLDARLETQLSRLGEALLAVRNGGTA